MSDEAVWKKVTKGRVGMRWDGVIENVWKEIGGSKHEILSRSEGAGHKTKS